MTRNCGSCTYGKYIDSSHVECHGNPPQVILLPGPPDLAGNPRMMAQKLRPQMENGERACSLWEASEKEQAHNQHMMAEKILRPGGVVIRP